MGSVAPLATVVSMTPSGLLPRLCSRPVSLRLPGSGQRAPALAGILSRPDEGLVFSAQKLRVVLATMVACPEPDAPRRRPAPERTPISRTVLDQATEIESSRLDDANRAEWDHTDLP